MKILMILISVLVFFFQCSDDKSLTGFNTNTNTANRDLSNPYTLYYQANGTVPIGIIYQNNSGQFITETVTQPILGMYTWQKDFQISHGRFSLEVISLIPGSVTGAIYLDVDLLASAGGQSVYLNVFVP
jgi:hypothetical protein